MADKLDTREKYLAAASKEVKNGIDVTPFKERFKDEKHYDEDDWLMLRNFIYKAPVKKSEQNGTR